ncbi:MAG: hypothetical protein NW206_03015 [Hyphomonadaceae bacterium]|nr:hypothetical protein [Hyphomonadaceae bacterium]
MSKWSSVRSELRVKKVRHVSAIAAALIALAALGGCNRDREDEQRPSVRASTVVEPETRVDTVPQEEPGVARSTWRAINESARNTTGNLRVSIESVRGGPVIFAFANGVTLRAQPIAQTPSDNRSGVGGQSLAAVLGGDPRVDAFIYRVENETVAQSASHGGLCGADPTRYMAVSEFVDSSGRWVFKIASFKGDRQPGTSGADPGYCSSFGFQAQ